MIIFIVRPYWYSDKTASLSSLRVNVFICRPTRKAKTNIGYKNTDYN